IPPSGIKTRSGLNKTMARTTSSRKLKKSTARIVDLPIRRRYSIGRYSTVRSEQIIQRVIVVVNENHGGSRGKYGIKELRRNTRSPEFKSGILLRARKFANLFSMILAGRRMNGTFIIVELRAPTTISAERAISNI